ncbi:MAG TPA: hypothetical protein VK400_14665 [Pyrinomonadaceae bacterium]|nr:hypothetical protein [Pyrinomonadaceae bacterium]
MKKNHFLTRLVLPFGIALFLLGCQNNSTADGQAIQQKEKKINTEASESVDNPYEKLRDAALNTTPEMLGLKIASDETKVYGVVMDLSKGDGIGTFAFFQTGDASLYTSSGSGIIGGINNENVKNAAVAFIDKAQTFLNRTTKTETTPLPPEKTVIFYFLTNKGKFVAQEKEENFYNNTSQWLGLYIEANKVITEIRLMTEKDKK